MVTLKMPIDPAENYKIQKLENIEHDLKIITEAVMVFHTFLKDEYERLGRNFKKKELEEMPFYVGFKRDYMIDDFLK